MTAFGKAILVTSRGRYSLEISSVNKKHLDIIFFIPPEFNCLENDLRQSLLNIITRGQVNVRINVTYEKSSPIAIQVNKAYLHSLVSAWQEVITNVNEMQGSSLSLSSSLFAEAPNLFTFVSELADIEGYRSDLLTLLNSALSDFLKMKKHEGQQLFIDIIERVAVLKEHCKLIQQQVPKLVPKYREKILSKLSEVLQQPIIEDERLLREVFLFADKVNIEEEITRLWSHLSQVESLLASEEIAKAKRFEFMLQEIVREVNTISSKAHQDLVIANLVVDMKCVLESIREQLQNVE